MSVNWIFIAASSFLRASSVSRTPAVIQGRRVMTETLQKARGVGLEQRCECTLYSGLEVRGCVLSLPLSVLQLLLQFIRVLVCLARHGLLDALDLARRRDLRLQLRLTSHGGPCMRIGRLPQQTCPHLCPLSRRLHIEQQRSLKPHGIQAIEARTKGAYQGSVPAAWY
jgi:hypothetical protein